VKKISKSERIITITKILTEDPMKIFTLNYFVEKFDCAKSTVSEDIDYIKKDFLKFELGSIETIAGAAGGVLYKPTISKQKVENFCEQLCEKIKEENRIITGGYIYMNDILYDPAIAAQIGKIFADPFQNKEIDYVVTVEAKGIPIALMTARMLNKPMIVVRKSAKLTEGTTIQMNYISGSSKRIQTMALAKRAIKKNSRILFIDDFMKAGATAKGIIELMKEFESEVVGVAVVMATAEPNNKLIENYNSLIVLDHIDSEKGEICIYPINDER